MNSRILAWYSLIGARAVRSRPEMRLRQLVASRARILDDTAFDARIQQQDSIHSSEFAVRFESRQGCRNGCWSVFGSFTSRAVLCQQKIKCDSTPERNLGEE